MTSDPCLHRFAAPVDHLSLPERFTFPFRYEPHPLCRIAVEELQARIRALLPPGEGKMFGVLVVRDGAGALGYLAAFSGLLAGRSLQTGFVPPVYDLTDPDGFFKREEAALTALNQRIAQLERAPAFLGVLEEQRKAKAAAGTELGGIKRALKAAKQERARLRRESSDPGLVEAQHRERLALQYDYKRLAAAWHKRLQLLGSEVTRFAAPLAALKAERRARSAALQARLFAAFTFLNARGQRSGLDALFAGSPPAGAGECAGPRLLHYAYVQGYKPLALAEFWMGAAPGSEVRREGCFYPACKAKCGPILGFMLQGLAVDPDPTLVNLGAGSELVVIYEDAALIAVNKPPGLLSEPGKHITDSVLTRLQARFAGTEGPFIVHRLDMATSGLLLLAKSKPIQARLQRQFEARTVRKRYVALLEGPVMGDGGRIELPLRLDPDNRPERIVDRERGQAAVTEWRVLARDGGLTRVEFAPLTGRTHQLRVHAAHPKGLDAPIAGDPLYGRGGPRLLLHACSLEVDHPFTGLRLHLECSPDF
jgi:tRNA pseudouridine32 synthase/23S rRNA pseudouridine746 synthase